MVHIVSAYLFCHQDTIETRWSHWMFGLAEKEAFSGLEVSLPWLRNEFIFPFVQEDSVLHLFAEAKTLDTWKDESCQLSAGVPSQVERPVLTLSKNLSISVFFQGRCFRNNLVKLLHFCGACIPDLHTQLWKFQLVETKVEFSVALWCKKHIGFSFIFSLYSIWIVLVKKSRRYFPQCFSYFCWFLYRMKVIPFLY